MSQASTYAARIRAAEEETVTSEATKPPSFVYAGGTVEVTREGGCHIDKEALLTAAEALSLGQWLQGVFSEA